MQSNQGFAASNEDVAAYVATMSRQLAEVCALAGLCKAARLLEEAAIAANPAGQGEPDDRSAARDQEKSSESRNAASPPG